MAVVDRPRYINCQAKAQQSQMSHHKRHHMDDITWITRRVVWLPHLKTVFLLLERLHWSLAGDGGCYQVTNACEGIKVTSHIEQPRCFRNWQGYCR